MAGGTMKLVYDPNRVRNARMRGRGRKYKKIFPKISNNVKRYVKTVVKNTGERKYIDYSVNGALPATHNYMLLNGLQQGTTPSQRVGRKVQMKSVELSGYVTESSSNQGWFYMALIYDIDADGSAFTYQDVYTTAPTSGDIRNLNNSDRFKVIKRWKVYLNANSNERSKNAPIDFYKKIDLPVEFNGGNAGTVADIQTGSLYLYYTSDDRATTSLILQTRVRYTDM